MMAKHPSGNFVDGCEIAPNCEVEHGHSVREPSHPIQHDFRLRSSGKRAKFGELDVRQRRARRGTQRSSGRHPCLRFGRPQHEARGQRDFRRLGVVSR
jgi:hypothetical protein